MTLDNKSQKVTVYASYVLYRRMWCYMSEYWLRFVFSILAMVVAAATEPAFARIMKPLIDNGFIAQDKKAIILTPLIVMAIFLVRGVASYANDYLTNWLSGSIVEKMRRIMFSRLLKLPVEYYDNNNSGRIMSRIIFDVTQITEAGFNMITVIFKDGITVIALLGLLFYTDWQLTLFCFVTLPFILILVRILAYRLRELSAKNQQQYGEMTQIITEAVQGQKIVKLFGGVDYEEARFGRSINSIKNNNVKQAATSSLNSGISQFLVACALSMILYFAVAKSRTNNFTAGDFVSFITAMIMVFAPVKRITSVTQSLQKGLTAAESVFNFLDNKEETNTGKIKLEKISQSICFKNVVFRYVTSEKNILDNFSLDIKVGETIALVGSSGGGKTTIANLLPRFYNIDSGQILIDGINLVNFELSSLRQNIAFVGQEVVLFNDTVYNNITYGLDKNIIYENVVNAAKLSNSLEFIEQLPQGFDTYIGENGTRLSGGQKQRLAIARAILKNSAILILDEATSALDNQSEKLVQDALDKLMKSKTTIVIAHRLSTVLHANRIVVMEGGNAVEVGTHNELLDKGGFYAKLYNVQLNLVDDLSKSIDNSK